MKCCICKKEIEGFGNSPEGAMWRNIYGDLETLNFAEADRCCDDCNTRFVIPGRLYQLRFRKVVKD